jgi:[Skp1-protein]-hydroxyproline N-acetylglucosaminyltransferase
VQYHADHLSDACEETSEKTQRPVLRALFIPATDAAGPCPARAIIQERLYRGERYYFQIDAHMRFSPNWDVRLVEDLKNLEKIYRRPIITDYPPGYKSAVSDDARLNEDDASKQTISDNRLFYDDVTGAQLEIALDANKLRATHFDEDGMLHLAARPRLTGYNSVDARIQPFIAAGFLFTRARPLLSLCPYDASLRWLVFGEEVLFSARLWTHGFDFFSPDIQLSQSIMQNAATRQKHHPATSTTLCWHQWKRAGRATSWQDALKNKPNDEVRAERKASQLLVKRILCSEHAADQMDLATQYQRGGRYGLGTVRTISEYEAFCGVDFNSQTVRISE